MKKALIASAVFAALSGAAVADTVVAIAGPMSGQYASAGDQIRKGAEMAIADINAGGGIKAMGGAKLEALLGDAQGRAEIAASLVDQMAEAGASGFTGCFASPLGLAATTAAANRTRSAASSRSSSCTRSRRRGPPRRRQRRPPSSCRTAWSSTSPTCSPSSAASRWSRPAPGTAPTPPGRAGPCASGARCRISKTAARTSTERQSGTQDVGGGFRQPLLARWALIQSMVTPQPPAPRDRKSVV